MAQLAKKQGDDKIARPLNVLVPLIQADLKHGSAAAEEAGLPYYRAAGEKMLEAKPQIPHGNFRNWIERNFPIRYKHARRYMQLAEETTEKSLARDFSSLGDFLRQSGNEPSYNRPVSWQKPVKQIVSRVDTETLNLKKEELKRADERDAQRKLALQLIDIGYKVLARELQARLERMEQQRFLKAEQFEKARALAECLDLDVA
jgi:hypothetical protein